MAAQGNRFAQGAPDPPCHWPPLPPRAPLGRPHVRCRPPVRRTGETVFLLAGALPCSARSL